MKDKETKKAFSLIELVLAVALFSFVFTTVSLFSVDALRSDVNQRTRSEAQILIQETIQGIEILKDEKWGELLAISDSNPRHIQIVNGEAEIINGEFITGGFSISFTVSPARRDINGQFVSTVGTLDPRSKQVIITAKWNNVAGEESSIFSTFFLNSWHTSEWVDTTENEFNSGTLDTVIVSNDFGGEVQLASPAFSNWCQPELTQTIYDIPGNGIPTIVSSIPGKAFLGSTSYSLQNLLIDHSTDPAGVTIEAEFSGYSTTGIYGDANYTYLATTTDNREVVILDTDTAPYSEIGYFDASGTTDPTSVYVNGNVGYVAQGRVLRSFDLSSKIGSRPQLDSLTVGLFSSGYITEIEIRGNYAFLSMYDDWYELIIVNITNPSDIRVVKNKDLNFSQSSDLYVSEDGNRVFIGTTYSSFWDEFFILDSTNKTGSVPILDSYDTNGMSVTGNTVTDDRVVIVGYGGQEYQVVDITNITNIQYCGGLDVPSGFNGVTSVRTPLEDVFSYVIGNASNEEFRVIKGGLGSGGSSFEEEGEFISSIFDTTYNDPSYHLIQWTSSIPGNTSLELQVRAPDNSDMSGANWVGPDNTGSTYFTNGEREFLPDEVQNKDIFSTG